MTDRLLNEREALEILEYYVPANQLERVRAILNLPALDRDEVLQERVYLFENTLGRTRIELLLLNEREISIYLTWIPWDDRLPSREEYCAGITEALQKIWWASDQLNDPYVLKHWWVNDEEDYDLKDAWRDRKRHTSSRFIGLGGRA